jgi:hypothetical protein
LVKWKEKPESEATWIALAEMPPKLRELVSQFRSELQKKGIGLSKASDSTVFIPKSAEKPRLTSVGKALAEEGPPSLSRFWEVFEGQEQGPVQPIEPYWGDLAEPIPLPEPSPQSH